MLNGATGNILMDDPFFIIIIISYILLGRILQLPRGKEHMRTLESHASPEDAPTHPLPPPIHIQKTATAP